ncbi:MAG: SDR family oxidoreductase, partial [Gammaproteobacteria bacterium]
MNILLFGGAGQVGWELQRALAPLGRIIAPGRQACDLTDPDAIRRTIADASARVVVNAAAYTAVDKAETEAAQARLINAEAVGALAGAARDAGALLVHYSTDYVFDGSG